MIHVPCACGKTYEVPDDKVGRKLQCRRCGAVRRITRKPRTDSDEPFVVPFHAPGDSDGDSDGLALAPVDGPPLDIKQPLRRCPSCGTQDEASVVVCVRCGYDWRRGKRLGDAVEADDREAQAHGAKDAERELRNLGALGWTSLAPFGIILGPYVVLRSLAVERKLRAYSGSKADLQQVQQVRLTAFAGAILWAIVCMLGVFVLSRSTRGASEGAPCRARLVLMGSAIRARAEKATFPKDRDFPGALAEIADEQEAGKASLYCPLGGGIYPYGRREEEVLAGGTNPDYLLLWDVEPHPEEKGSAPVFRALRFDGRVEAFKTHRALDRARKRPGFKVVAGGGKGKTPGVQGGGQTHDGGEGAVDSGEGLGRFMAFAAEYAADDPEFRAGASIPVSAFVEAVGVPPGTLMPVLLKHADLRVRVAVASMLPRVKLGLSQKGQLANLAKREGDPGILLGAGLALLQVGDVGWVQALVEVVEDGNPGHLLVARRVISQEAVKSKAVVVMVLEQAAIVRQRINAVGDEAMFPMPPEALPHVVALLADRRVSREAAAVLFSANEEGVEVLVPALKSPDLEVRRAILGVLDKLREKDVLGLEEFLELVSRERDLNLRGEALQALSRQSGSPPRPLVVYALSGLRDGTAQRDLGEVYRRVIGRVGLPGSSPASLHEEGLGWLLDDLAQEGDHTGVVRELGAPARLTDALLDTVIGQRISGIPDPGIRQDLVRVCEARPQPSSLEVLLKASTDADPAVRAAALTGLRRSGAPQSAEFRQRVGKMLAKRLSSEKSAGPRAELFKLARGLAYCGKSDEGAGDDHRCDPGIQRTLKTLCRDGDRTALRTLATHPDQRLLSFLLEQMEANPSDSDLRVDISNALRSLSGQGLTSPRAAAWREILQQRAKQIDEHVRNAANKQRERIAVRRQKAEARLEDLRR